VPWAVPLDNRAELIVQESILPPPAASKPRMPHDLTLPTL
jgi:hypothetical protein